MESDLLAFISGDWLEKMHEDWQRDNNSVSAEWNSFFKGLSFAAEYLCENPALDNVQVLKHSGVQSLIYRYRNVGHLLACTDPLSPCQLSHPLLELSCFGLDQGDLDKSYSCRRYINPVATLRDILEVMRQTYCREIGVEFMHIQEPGERQWLIDAMEPCRNKSPLSSDEKLHVLELLHKASLFESFLHRRFIGQKRFSLEGGEVLIPLLDRIVKKSVEVGISDLIFGMSHRGRLNVLAHIFNKSYESIIAEFNDTHSFGFVGDGDVKYHKGHSTEVTVNGRSLHLTLAANPSHLEAVNSVVVGKCRARQDSYGENGKSRVLPVLIHGDAAFAGQGSVMELLNLSQLQGYCTGGTVHIVLNNQIGFTTVPEDSRSTRYATDVAKMLACPIFHVQGESPEAALHIAGLALDYRMTYGRDVVIELTCYRRHGHNEGDEPAFTQPLMYRQISARPPVNKMYSETVLQEGCATHETLQALEQDISDLLEASLGRKAGEVKVGFSDKWRNISRGINPEFVDTSVSTEKLLLIARKLAEFPPGFVAHFKISSLIQKRFQSVLKGHGIDWGNAENLAYATLLNQGISVRISGQDSRRGTFNHRHCVVIDTDSEDIYIPLDAVSAEGAKFQAWNSSLSEFGVLGFEYGYSLETPDTLTIWEAQFGDFANGAQVIIDQFISSGESKWSRASGIVLFLPHGYEGQGAEHSSARIERFLQACAQDNLVVVSPSSPAQIFHLLRRQVLQSFRKPLIVFTPKSLLRHPQCISTVQDLTTGRFMPVICCETDFAAIRRLLFCSGKLYYELLSEQERSATVGVAIIRIEQLYPFDTVSIENILSQCSGNCSLFWVQEEPQNMGAWSYIRDKFQSLSANILYIGRPESAAPAVGSHKLHEEQQADLIKKAFYE